MTRWAVLALLVAAHPAAARDSLGVYSDWAAFRDPETPRCYAIAQGTGSQAYATIGTWPEKRLRNQFHLRLSRPASEQRKAQLRIGNSRFDLVTRGSDAWASDEATNAAIIAAMRSARRMSVSGFDERGRSFVDRYDLEGAATAMDAAVVGCAGARRS
ncbi:MAG: hypothetical protein V2J14_00585 [Erythrobacter sp.]|jgi:hypothetical protein|nr:hypothetical protein [Erythrobacter sp.]